MKKNMMIVAVALCIVNGMVGWGTVVVNRVSSPRGDAIRVLGGIRNTMGWTIPSGQRLPFQSGVGEPFTFIVGNYGLSKFTGRSNWLTFSLANLKRLMNIQQIIVSYKDEYMAGSSIGYVVLAITGMLHRGISREDIQRDCGQRCRAEDLDGGRVTVTMSTSVDWTQR